MMSAQPDHQRMLIHSASMLLWTCFLISFGAILSTSWSYASPAKPSADSSAESSAESSADALSLHQPFWEGRYDTAVQRYKEALRGAPQDEMLWYNLGTAEAHRGQYGQAAYALQRALLLSPDDADIKDQLSRVNQAAVEDGTRNPGSRRLVLPDELLSGGGLLGLISTNLWRSITLTSTSIACLCILILQRVRREQVTVWWTRRAPVIRAFTALLILVSIGTGVGWRAHIAHIDDAQFGVIITARAPLHRGPGERFAADFNIAGGVKLKMQGLEGDWRRVILSDGREGWLSATHIKALDVNVSP
jgi:hypothetical protein